MQTWEDEEGLGLLEIQELKNVGTDLEIVLLENYDIDWFWCFEIVKFLLFSYFQKILSFNFRTLKCLIKYCITLHKNLISIIKSENTLKIP